MKAEADATPGKRPTKINSFSHPMGEGGRRPDEGRGEKSRMHLHAFRFAKVDSHNEEIPNARICLNYLICAYRNEFDYLIKIPKLTGL
jgi:hypothetical protein